MNLFHVILLGTIEGITEFLPISSTAHLILFSHILNFSQNDFQKLYEVVIQGGAILAIIFLYFRFLLKNRFLWSKLIISFLPTAFFGFIFYRLIKNVFFEVKVLILGSLFVIGLTFIFIESLINKKKIVLRKKLVDLRFFYAFLIGVFQSLAIIPGVSRAGIIILVMLLLGFKREEAAIYSFLLAVPTILSAAFFDLYKNRELLSAVNANKIQILILGTFISFITALISVKWLITFLKKNSLITFGWYRIIFSLIYFLLFILL